MSTPEERQEAAEYLRENSIGDVIITPYTVHADPIRFPGYKLADLIDPTCHMVDTDHEYEDSIRCDVCQMTFNRPWEPFKFCPNCGARVVDEDAD